MWTLCERSIWAEISRFWRSDHKSELHLITLPVQLSDQRIITGVVRLQSFAILDLNSSMKYRSPTVHTTFTLFQFLPITRHILHLDKFHPWLDQMTPNPRRIAVSNTFYRYPLTEMFFLQPDHSENLCWTLTYCFVQLKMTKFVEIHVFETWSERFGWVWLQKL